MRTRFGYNSTIQRREKICVSCGKPCYPFSKGRCQPCSTIETTQKRMDEVSESLIEEEGLTELIKEADEIVSKFVRLNVCDKEGNCKCYTCGVVMRWQDAQAGHFIPRSHLLLRFDADRNLRVQCSNCNCGKHGNLAVFAQTLEKEKPGLPDILQKERAIVYKLSRDEVKGIIRDYTNRVFILLKSIQQ